MNRFSQFIPSEYVPLDTNLLLKAGMYAEQNALEDLNKINKAIGTINAIPAKYTQDSEYLKSKLDQTRSNISGLISNTSEFTQPDFVGKINQEVYNFTNDPNIRQILNDNQHWEDVQKSRVKNYNQMYDGVLAKDLQNTKNFYSETGKLTDMTQIPYSFKPFDTNKEFVETIKALEDNKVKTDSGYTVTEVITNAFINKDKIDPTRLTNALNLVLQNSPELNTSLELEYRYQNELGFLDPVDLKKLNEFKQAKVLNYANTYLKLETTQELGDLSKYYSKLQMKESMKNKENPSEKELTYETVSEDNFIDEDDAENELKGDGTLPSFSNLEISEQIEGVINMGLEGFDSLFGTDLSTPTKPKKIQESENVFKKTMQNSNLKDLSTEGQILVYKKALKNTRNSGHPLLTIYTKEKNKQYDYFNKKENKEIILNNIVTGKVAIMDKKEVELKKDDKDYPTDIKENFIFAGYDPIKGYLKYVHDGTKKIYYVQPPQSFTSANEIIKNINNSRYRIGNRFINIGNGKQIMTYTDVLKNQINNEDVMLNTVVYDEVYSPSEFANLKNKDILLYHVYSKEGERLDGVEYNKAPNDAKIVVTQDQSGGTSKLKGIAIDDYNIEIFNKFYTKLVK